MSFNTAIGSKPNYPVLDTQPQWQFKSIMQLYGKITINLKCVEFWENVLEIQ